MKKDENQHKNHAIVTFVGKSWISEPSFFLDIFTLEDAVFHGLSPGRIKFMGHPHFQPKSSNYLKKIEKIMIFSSKNHRIDPFFLKWYLCKDKKYMNR
jgi:hypothetical protein